jgi:hypothetical protein
MRYGSSHPPLALWFIVISYLLFTSVQSPNLLISIPVFIYPLFLYRLFWVAKQPNVLFWGLLFQWSNVSAQLLYSTFLGISLADYMKGENFPLQYFDKTVLLSIVALYFFAFGLFLAVKQLKMPDINKVIEKYSPKSTLRWYIIVSIIIYLSRLAIWGLGAFVQYFYFFFYVKWGFFLITFYVVHKRAPQLRWVLYFAIAVECILGLSSFFADAFLNILIYSFIGITTLQPKIKFTGAVILVVMAVIFFNIAVYWTASKQAYRQFLNKGEVSQAVLVSQSDALNKLKELVSNIDDETYSNSIRVMVDRIGYIQYFDATLGYVPTVVPHQNGSVYAKAIAHYLVPRFLDPHKEILDDSKHTNEFTGLGLGDASSATSFSLGTVADAYIDFGEVFMNVPIFLFGYLIGLCFSYLWKTSPNQYWAWFLTGAFYLLVPIYGADTTKAIGFISIYFVTIVFVKGRLIRILDPRLRA